MGNISLKKAAMINAVGKYSKVFLTLIVNAILARIVSPEDYGVVAVITVFSTFFTTFSDMGFGPAIVQSKDLTEEDINNIYSFSVWTSVGLMTLFGGCSHLIAAFYNDSIYIGLGYLLSVSLLFNALNMVPNGLLSREKKFISIALRTVIVYLAAAVITIVLALIGLRFYALAIQAILTALLTFLWNYATTKPKFYLRFQWSGVEKVLNYSSYQFAFNLVNYFSRNLDNLLTGKLMGTAQLGYYSTAYNLMLYPVNGLTGVISPVLHPILSDYQDQLAFIYQKYMKLVRLLACMGLYVAPVCFLAADEMIAIMYGTKWSQSAICFQILSIAILPQMINSSAGAVFQSIGNTRLLFISSCVNTVVTVAAILAGVFVGGTIKSLSICVATAYCFHFLSAFFLLIKYGFRFRFRNFVKELLPEVLILIVMVVAVGIYPIRITNFFVSAIVKGAYLGIIYLSVLRISGEYKLFISLIKK